jgi:uncharacterized protein DUF7005
VSDLARLRFWMRHGATDGEAEELAAYARSGFDESAFDRVLECPLPDEPFVSAWAAYAADAERIGVAESLRRRLIQLRFPIEEGISATPSYLAAVRRGMCDRSVREPGVRFARPDLLRMFIHPTAAGRVPVIVAGPREDFVSLVRALTCRNEPKPVPPSMGACIVAGYNNWDRVVALGSNFVSLIDQKSLYQDRFIILSSGPYSGVSAADVGVPDGQWLETSFTIRLEHECAHYVTRQALGAMRNSILDEVIADYVGIVSATNGYRGDWFLRFLGLESPAVCRADGRIHTYRGAPALSDRAFAILQDVIRLVVRQLEAFDTGRRRRAWTPIEAARIIVGLARIGLEGLGAEGGSDSLEDAVSAASGTIRARDPLSASTSSAAERSAVHHHALSRDYRERTAPGPHLGGRSPFR